MQAEHLNQALSAAALARCGSSLRSDSAPAASAASPAADNGRAKKKSSAQPSATLTTWSKIQPALEKGYTVKLVEFTDSSSTLLWPKAAGHQYFQHKPYLDDFKKKNVRWNVLRLSKCRLRL